MNNGIFNVISTNEFLSKINQIFGLTAKAIGDIITHCEKEENSWMRLENWESLNDLEIYSYLEQTKTPVGILYIVSEVSYRPNLGVFAIKSADIKEFISNHHTIFGECFFNGDVLIFSPEQRAVWIFHHEGAFALFTPAIS